MEHGRYPNSPSPRNRGRLRRVIPVALVSVPSDATPRSLPWLSSTTSPPRKVGLADDRTKADDALRRIRSGEALLYEGDFHNARQLLAALGRRLAPRRSRGAPPAEAFRRERHRRREAHLLLNRLLVPVAAGWRIPLPRAPDVSEALGEALGPAPEGEGLLPLREVLGAVGAHEWRRSGVRVAALGERVHPHHGVFAPVRGEYADLAGAVLAGRDLAGKVAFDVGTGTGVLAFLAARRGARVVATDSEPRAVACARENAVRLGLADRVEVRQADLFPEGRADLVLCNPPWIPADAHTPLERAVYDPGGRFLAGFLAGLADHLAPGERDGSCSPTWPSGSGCASPGSSRRPSHGPACGGWSGATPRRRIPARRTRRTRSTRPAPAR